MFSFLFSQFRGLFKNPMTLFVYGIVSKWYVMVMVTAMVVTYWVFRGLSDAGVITAAEQVVSQAFGDAKSVSQNCVPKIADPKAFWECLSNPPKYRPTGDEDKLQKNLENLVDINKYLPPEDPYSNKTS